MESEERLRSELAVADVVYNLLETLVLADVIHSRNTTDLNSTKEVRINSGGSYVSLE